MKKNSKAEKKVCAIIAAAGQSSRMQLDGGASKLFLELKGKPVIQHTIQKFNDCTSINSIIIVCREVDIPPLRQIVSDNHFTKVAHIISGGKTRQDSVQNALEHIPKGTDFIAIHDGARCLISESDVKKIIFQAFITGAATAATIITDTVKRADKNRIITETIPRENLYAVQTPQVFLLDVYRSGLAMTLKKGAAVTDDCSIAENAGFKVSLVLCNKENIKITTQEDLWTANKLYE